jgi:hypothetical protein
VQLVQLPGLIRSACYARQNTDESGPNQKAELHQICTRRGLFPPFLSVSLRPKLLIFKGKSFG